MIVQNIGRRARSWMAVLPALGAAAACAPNTSGSTLATCSALSATAPQRPTGWTGTVFTIVMENHSRDAILGNAQAPYINALAKQNAVAGGYHDSYVHPSEPNYIWMIAGQNFGILNDDDPNASQTIDASAHLADQLERAGLGWKSYQESMGDACGLTSHGLYAAKHDPFIYFSDINGWDGKTFQPSARCNQHVVDHSQLDADIAAGTVPSYAFITPNLINDMHDGSVAQGDAWLAQEIPKLQATDAYKKGGVIFLLWDEGTSQTDDPPFIAISPNAKAGYTSQANYDTSSYLKTVQALMGVEPLPCGGATTSSVTRMDDLFTVAM
jgi:phospholipase C